MKQKLLHVLQNCKTLKHLNQIHNHIIINGLADNHFFLPKLITLASSIFLNNNYYYSFKIFQASSNPGIVSYNTAIQCLSGRDRKFAIYNRMKGQSGVMPNNFTITFMFKSFSGLMDGSMVHVDVFKLGYGISVFVQNALLDFYGKCCEDLSFAKRVFEEMCERDVVTWNSMIGVYLDRGEVGLAIGLFDGMTERSIVTWNSVVSGVCKLGNVKLAREVFERMPERNEVSWNAMVSGYVKVGDMENAECVFQRMPRKTVVSWTAILSGYVTLGDVDSARRAFDRMPFKNVVSWNAMIGGYVHNRMFNQALDLFQHMLIDNKCKPDQGTLVSVLSACSHLGSLEHGKWIDSFINKNKLDLSLSLGNALIDMFAKCGDVENAKTTFNKMSRKCIITWTSMVSGLAVNGECREALALFDRMCSEGVKPDDVIFIAVFTACTHGGLVEEGKRVFDQMTREYNLKPRIEHYGCMVDLLSRAGRLEEAAKFIESMHLEPNAVIWATLLSSCRFHGNGELLESVTKKIMDQEPSNPGYFTLVSNLSASVGQWKDALGFRTAMRKQSIEKVPGCSSIQVGNCVHEFLAKDTRHEARKDIYKLLNSINWELKRICEIQQHETDHCASA